jgi:hypothetical protein
MWTDGTSEGTFSQKYVVTSMLTIQFGSVQSILKDNQNRCQTVSKFVPHLMRSRRITSMKEVSKRHNKPSEDYHR